MSEKDNKVTEENKGQKKPAEVWSEKAESKSPEISPEEMKTLASAYAKYLAEKKMKPGDATFIEPEELTGKAPEVKAEATAETPAKKPAAPETKAEQLQRRHQRRKRMRRHLQRRLQSRQRRKMKVRLRLKTIK